MAKKRAAASPVGSDGATANGGTVLSDVTGLRPEPTSPLVVFAGGQLDVEAAESLLLAFRQALTETRHGLSIDLADAETAHTAALQILVAAARVCGERGQSFDIRRVSAPLSTQIRLAGLGSVLGLGDDASPALPAVTGQAT